MIDLDQKLKDFKQEIDDYFKKRKIESDLEKDGSNPHMINLIINMQELNKKLDGLDKTSILNLTHDFKLFVQQNLNTLSNNMVQYNEALSKLDASKLIIKIDWMNDRLDKLESKVEQLIEKRQLRIFIEDTDGGIAVRTAGNKSVVVNENELRLKLGLLLSGLDWSMRTERCLYKSGIKTIGELIIKSETDLLKIPLLGKQALREIINKLGTMGLYLGMDVPANCIKV